MRSYTMIVMVYFPIWNVIRISFTSFRRCRSNRLRVCCSPFYPCGYLYCNAISGYCQSMTIFAADKYYYIIIYSVTGSFWEDDAEVWNAIAQSIKVTVTPEEAYSNSIDSSGEENYDYPNLEKGDKGEDVKSLQQRLVDLYWLQGSVDGDYGNKTKDAVERFQKAAGLLVTGIADGKTQAHLFSDDAPEAEMSVSCATTIMGNSAQTAWNVNGQSFTLKDSQIKTLKTPWGTYKFDARGKYNKID